MAEDYNDRGRSTTSLPDIKTYTFAPRAQEPSQACSLALVLLIDKSGSMKQVGWRKEIDGTAAAFNNPQTIALMQSTIDRPAPFGGPIAVTALAFDGDVHEMMPWQLLSSEQTIKQFAAEMHAIPDVTLGNATQIGLAMDAALQAFGNVPCIPAKKKIDVVTDGQDSNRDLEDKARDRAVAASVQINGLGIGGNGAEAPEEALRRHVITPRSETVPEGFAMRAETVNEFAAAFQRKLETEIADVIFPPPPFGAGHSQYAAVVR